MIRHKEKEQNARSFRIRKDVGERLDQYSEESMIPKTAIVEKALIEYLDKMFPTEEDKSSK